MPLLCPGLSAGLAGWFNPEALDLLLSSGPPPLRCTRPAGYGSLICLKADKSPPEPCRNLSFHTNLEPSHILALLHNLLFSCPWPRPHPLESRLPASSLPTHRHRLDSSLCSSTRSLGSCETVQPALQVPAQREGAQKRQEVRKRLRVDCALLVFDRVRPRGIRNLQFPTAQIALIRAHAQNHFPRCKRQFCSPTPGR